jgi:hypothetical protein
VNFTSFAAAARLVTEQARMKALALPPNEYGLRVAVMVAQRLW